MSNTPDRCPTCNRKNLKRVYTITGIFQHLGKIHSSNDLLGAKKYIYSVLDQLGATDEQKESISQRIESGIHIPHSRDDVYDIVNEILALARTDLVKKGASLWYFIRVIYLETGIDESFADFYKEFIASTDEKLSTQSVSRLLKAIGIKAKTKKIGNSSCMYFKISSGELREKINTLGIGQPSNTSDIEDNVVPCSSSINVYKKLIKSGHPQVSLLILDHGQHAKILSGKDGYKYQAVVHAFYKKHNLPYDASIAEIGESFLNAAPISFIKK